jgi:hypothetical protein
MQPDVRLPGGFQVVTRQADVDGILCFSGPKSCNLSFFPAFPLKEKALSLSD